MLYINGNEIRLTRGDTAYLTVPIINEATGEEYVMAKDDILTFSMKRNINDPRACLQKVCVGSNEFHIAPKDTAGFEFAKYKYDVQLSLANGDIYTVIEPTSFRILEEVSC